MTDLKNSLDINLETMLEFLRGYLRSEITVTNPNPITSSETNNKVKSPELVNIKIKVRNTAQPRDGFGEVVFVGVGLSITCNGNSQIIEKLKNTVRNHTIQQWQQYPSKSVIWYVNTWVEEEDDGSTHRQRKLDGDTLFPGDSKDYEIKVPFESLPYLSIKVNGYISPGNLFKSGQVLQGFEKWSKPELMSNIKALVDLKIHLPVRIAIAGIPEFGPKTTFEEITGLRKTINDSLENIKNIKQSLQQMPNRVMKNGYQCNNLMN
jgi:hypothetical protein